MKRLTTDTPNGNFETILNFVYGKDGWAYIRHDGEREDMLLTNWAKRQCKFRGCKEAWTETPEEIDQRLCDCMMEAPICPIALAYCFASQAVHLRSRLKMHEDAMPLERTRELAQAEKGGRLVVLPDDKARWIKEILAERERQDQKWGYPQNNSYCEWASILAEEAGELAKELNEMNFGRGRQDQMEAEAVQVAAVALSILEQSAVAYMVTVQAAVSLGRLTREEAEAALKKREETDNAKD